MCKLKNLVEFCKIAVLRPYLLVKPKDFNETSYAHAASADEHFGV